MKLKKLNYKKMNKNDKKNSKIKDYKQNQNEKLKSKSLKKNN